MRKFLCLMVFLCAASMFNSLIAQQINNAEKQDGYVIEQYNKQPTEEETQMVAPRQSAIIQYSGKSYSYQDLYRLARRDVNGIAGITAGVDHIPGSGSVRIRGAEPSGTAYFVDGVRAYGTLPMSFR